MSINFCYLDVETTGIMPNKHDIIQLACVPIVNGVKKEPFNQFCQPLHYEYVEAAATAVHGITIPRMRTFQSQKALFDNFINYLDSFNVKFVISGFNVSFDKRFLSALFIKNNRESDFFRLFDVNIHDTFNRAKLAKKKGLLKLDSYKLTSLAQHFKFEMTAHEALSDIQTTILVDEQIGLLLSEEIIAADDLTLAPTISTSFREMPQLHVHSMYGFTESVPDVSEWTTWCENNKIPGFAIVDNGSASCLYDIISNKNTNVTAIPAMGLFLQIEGEPLYRVSAWATSNKGYSNLIQLASIGFNDAIEIDGVTYPRLLIEDFEEHKEDIIFGTGDLYGSIGDYILEGDAVKAENAFLNYIKIFGDALRAEFMPISVKRSYSITAGFQQIKKNKLIVDADFGKAYNCFLMTMVDKYNVKCVAVSGAHFIDPADKILQDCICRSSYKSTKNYSESYHAKNTHTIYNELFLQLGEWLSIDRFNIWIDNAFEILEKAKRISIKHEYSLPRIPIPSHIKEQSDDYDKQVYLLTIEKCIEHGRWNNDPIYMERLKKEIDVIMKNKVLNFLPYFLMYEDICSFARKNNILQNIARGSAGGCLLSYYLKIIHVDPVATNLPFERFLSHPRIEAQSFPDIDLDLASRAKVLSYLKSKYKAGFAQIGTFSKMKTKTAIRQSMFALYGLNGNDPIIKDVCNLIPDSPQGVDEYGFLCGYVDREGEYHQGILELVPEVAAFFKMYPTVDNMVKKILGITNGIGRHASGFIVSSRDITKGIVPVMQVFDSQMNESIAVTQWDASGCEKSGLIKADILGVTTVKTVEDCIALIKHRTGLDFMEEDANGVALIYRLPEKQSVYKDFYNKKTDSSFQFNTPLIKSFVRDFAPQSVHDLSVLTALARPGALDVEVEPGVSATQFYIDVKNNRRAPKYIHPDLEGILGETYSVCCFQETLMEILTKFCGYSLAESDQIRSAIAKKKHDVMQKAFERVRTSTASIGWTPEQAQGVCDLLEAYSNYSFNKSHSLAYGIMGYITMYLKHFYPLEWWCSTLNHTDKEEKLRYFISLLGNSISSPSILNPSFSFNIVGDKILAPISVIKGIGGSCAAAIVENGPYVSLDDFIQKTKNKKIDRRHFLLLVKARMFDSLLDSSIPYIDARIKFMNEYVEKRGVKPYDEEEYKLTPMSMFLDEQIINKAFNKSIIEDDGLRTEIEGAVDELTPRHNKLLPYKRGIKGNSEKELVIANSINTIGKLIENGWQEEIGIFVLFQGSSIKEGISKKTKKPYCMLNIASTDGISVLESIIWDRKTPLKWPINSIIFIQGKPSFGYRGTISMTISNIERISK